MKALLALVAFLFTVVAASAQQPIPNQPVQFDPINSHVVSATPAGPAVVTIPGIVGRRIHVYSVTIWCGANPGASPPTTVIPVVQIMDGGVLVFATPSTFYTSGPAQAGVVYQQFPVGHFHWSPGLTAGLGATVVITGNAGGACGGSSGQFTFMSVQADQF